MTTDRKASAKQALELFGEPTRRWFQASFEAPTEAQTRGWPAIASGAHTLIAAPTGSGKTLAAFLWGIDKLSQGEDPEPGVRIVYVSPLKALAYDIERNLRAPMRGIGVEVSVGLRTGDTSQRDRRLMRREPPRILITTPESLYLMLSSGAREFLGGVETVFVDEIHAVAQSKRGAHLALTLERLENLVGKPVQRIGLSATQRPLETVAGFLVGPHRECEIVDASRPKELDLQICVPVDDMTDPAAGRESKRGHTADELPEPLPDDIAPQHASIWPAMYPELLRLVQEHTSTIIFVNNRRGAERLAKRLNELANENDWQELPATEHAGNTDSADAAGPPPGRTADTPAASGGRLSREPAPPGKLGPGGLVPGPPSEPRKDPRTTPLEPEPVEIARAHHGSLSHEERATVEELLKSGQLPCLVATSSLELGIDMGAVDLVIQVESPKSVTRGLQRIGRAGHGLGEVSKGRIFPKYRGDLLECAVVVKRMRANEIEETVVPRNPLDVLAQHLVSMAALDEWGVDDVERLVTSSDSFRELSREQLENVLDMLDGRYPSERFAELRPRIVWDRTDG
ncbi:MAG: ATP-dependent helicase Lhr and Lhr-like helicase, partial [Solirubrobacterales bacterium]|nr:ATP-dependent helicase Lhr and Lhr-like helicase [Solirubrobacterales bacterium]